MIKLTQPVIFSNYIRPVCLANLELSSLTYGAVVAWGVRDATNNPSDLPQITNIPILDKIECLKKNPGLLSIISDDLFCAGKSDSGVCKGDSGSGFYVENDGRIYLRGIVSSSTTSEVSGCSDAKVALYSDVLKYLEFFEEVGSSLKLEAVLYLSLI